MESSFFVCVWGVRGSERVVLGLTALSLSGLSGEESCDGEEQKTQRKWIDREWKGEKVLEFRNI